MAKHCTVCNKTYPDDLQACPHCQAAKPPSQHGPGDDDVMPYMVAGDSAVDLGKQPPRMAHDSTPPSDQALAALLGDVQEGSEGLPEPSSPSGKKPAEMEVNEVAQDILEVAPETAPAAPEPVAPRWVIPAPPRSDIIEIAPEDAPFEVPSHGSSPLAGSWSSVVKNVEGPGVVEIAPGEGPFELGPREAGTGEVDSGSGSWEEDVAPPPAKTDEPAPEAAGTTTPPVMPGPTEVKGAPATRIASKPPLPTMLAGPEAVADIPAGEPGGPALAGGIPNLELESKVHKDTGFGEVASDHVMDAAAAEASEASSGSIKVPPPPASADSDITVGEESGGVFDGEEILDVSEEASGPTLEAAAGPEAPGMASDSNVVTIADGTDEDILDAEEVMETAELHLPGGMAAEEDVLGHDVVVEGESQVGLGAAKAERTSGVDLIAEALESGVDLAGAAPAPASGKTSGVDIGGPDVHDVPTSEVNLADPSSMPKARKQGSSPALDEKSIEDILMSGDEPTVSPSSARRAAAAEAADVVEPFAETAPEAAEAEAVAEAETARPRAPEALAGRPRRGRDIGVGVLVGVLLMGVASAAFWFMDPLGLQKKQPQQSTPQPAAQAQPAPQLSPLQTAHGLMDKGNYGEAVTTLESAGDSPEVASARAQARWLKYLQENKDKALDAKAPEVLKALEESKVANNDLLQKQIMIMVAAPKAGSNDGASAKAVSALKQALATAKSDQQKAEQSVTAIAKALVDAKQIDDVKNFDVKKFNALVKDFAEAKNILGTLQTQLQVKGRAAVAKTVANLAAARADLDGKLKDVNDKLKEAKIGGEGAAGVAKLVESQNALEKERADLDSAVQAAFAILKEEQLAPPGVEPRKGLLEATKMALDKARAPVVVSLGQVASVLGGLGAEVGGIAQRGFDVGRLVAEVVYYRTREPLIQTPEQKLDIWVALLQDRSQKDARELAAATNEARWVLSDNRAGAEAKAKAQYVMGLVERNQGKYEEARMAFDQAVKAATAAGAGAWTSGAGQSLKELTDAAAYYLPRVARLKAVGDLKAALAELDTAVQVSPDDGRLFALRGLVRLEQAAGKPDADAQKLIRVDAETARKDARAAAEGSYLLGRLAEDLGDLDNAEKAYRVALKSHHGSAEEASRYIIALARVLQRERLGSSEAAPAQPEPKAKEPKVGQLSPANARLALLVAVLTGVQPGGDEQLPDAARLRESIELAKKLIDSADPKIKGQGYLLLGQALTKQGDRTEGLKMYTKGMELAYPSTSTKDLSNLVDHHPAFQQAERGGGPPDSFVAERNFGKGLHLFWAADYPAAEAEFLKALAHNKEDARYEYFVGLSQLLQATRSKREAARYHLEQGARLEAEHRPGPVIVNASLERLQGQLRYVLDEYRQKSR
jgi:hypothetical protein